MLFDSDDDLARGDWLHEVKRDKLMDEARCEICVNYRTQYVGVSKDPFGAAVMRFSSRCALGRRLEPCRDFLREIGADDE